MNLKRAAIYARYSTDKQSDTSIEDQVALCERFAKAQGHPVAEVYGDAAKSGASIHQRYSLQAMLKAARRKEFDTILIENGGRLSRSSADMSGIFDELDFLGVSIIPVKSGQALTSTTAAVEGLVAQLQREQTADMVHRGMTGLIGAGKTVGGRAYGYRSVPKLANVKGGELEKISEEAEIVHEIFRRYRDGNSPKSIAAELNRRKVPAPRGDRWMDSTITGFTQRGTGILNNELFIGVVVWNKVKMKKDPRTGLRVSRPHPQSEWLRTEKPELRIVDDELWQAVRARRDQRAGMDRKQLSRKKRIFTGLIKCGACGSGFSSKGKDSTGRVRYGCSRDIGSGDCPAPRTYYVDEIEERVLYRFRAELRHPKVIRAFLDEYQKEMRRLTASAADERGDLEARLAKLSAKGDRLFRLLADGIGDEVRTGTELKAIAEEEKELKGRIALADAKPSHVITLHPATMDRYLSAVERLHEMVGHDGEGEDSTLIREVIDKVILHPVGEPGKGRWAQPPEIEVVGRLDSLIGECVLMEPRKSAHSIGASRGSGGGT